MKLKVFKLLISFRRTYAKLLKITNKYAKLLEITLNYANLRETKEIRKKEVNEIYFDDVNEGESLSIDSLLVITLKNSDEIKLEEGNKLEVSVQNIVY